jgi:serine protease Do
VVSGLSRSITAGDGGGQSEFLDKVIQTDAAINPGNSGGPLLNLSGKVIGVNVAVAQGSQSIGFALPINSIKSVVESVKTTGKIVRPYIGIRYVAVTPELKEKNNLSVDYGILVSKGATSSDLAIIPGSPANKAGIVENDIILELDGKKLDEDQDFATLIRQKQVGDTVKLRILSKGVEKNVQVKLETAPENN